MQAILYPDGQLSFIYPHMDAHHKFRERLTVVLELQPSSLAGESLHFCVGGEELRVPSAGDRKQQLVTATQPPFEAMSRS